MAPASLKNKIKKGQKTSLSKEKHASPKSNKKEKTNEVIQDIEDSVNDEESILDDIDQIENVQQRSEESTGLITTTNVKVYQLSELTEEAINKLEKNRRDLQLAQIFFVVSTSGPNNFNSDRNGNQFL